MTLTIGSLFTGIGGLDLGVEAALDGDVVWQVERDDFCRRVLAKHWPDADRSVVDVEDREGTARLASVDVVVGGFPCQDLSKIGEQAGMEGSRSGLWRAFTGVVAAKRPLGVVVENIGDHIWPRWLPVVRADLHALGYTSVSMELYASDVGLPHRRGRCFVVAADSDVERLERRKAHRGRTTRSGSATRTTARRWASRSPRPEVCRVADGAARGLDRRRLKALGNAVVPDVAFVVGMELRKVLVDD